LKPYLAIIHVDLELEVLFILETNSNQNEVYQVKVNLNNSSYLFTFLYLTVCCQHAPPREMQIKKAIPERARILGEAGIKIPKNDGFVCGMMMEV